MYIRGKLQTREPFGSQTTCAGTTNAESVKDHVHVGHLVGCLFHLGQNMWRKVKDHNMAAAYREDENLLVCLYVKMLSAHVFFPVAHDPATFNDLVESCPLVTSVMAPLTDYWEDAYISCRKQRGRRANPVFALGLWNVRGRLVARPTQSIVIIRRFENLLSPPSIIGLVDCVRIKLLHEFILCRLYC